MLRDALYLMRQDLRHMFRARETWLWTFLMPIVFFYFIGTITGGYSSPGLGPSRSRSALPPMRAFWPTTWRSGWRSGNTAW